MVYGNYVMRKQVYSTTMTVEDGKLRKPKLSQGCNKHLRNDACDQIAQQLFVEVCGRCRTAHA